MADSKDSKSSIEEAFNIQNKLKPMTSLSQLLGCYLVSEAIVHIQTKRTADLKGKALEAIPQLVSSDSMLNEVYDRFAKLVNYKIPLLLIVRKCLDDMDTYGFKSDQSINKSSAVDVEHLRKEHGTSFSKLEDIDLQDHSLRVFDNALTRSEANGGRSIKMATPIIAALLHDFGKSSKLREELIGVSTGEAYKKHASVSAMYVNNILIPEFPELSESLSVISILVENHHPSNAKMKNNKDIAFLIEMDHMARKQELMILEARKK